MRIHKLPGSLFKKPGTASYYMRFKDPATGRWKNQSTGEADPEKASRVLQQAQAAYLATTSGLSQRELQQRLPAADVAAPTVAELMEWWMARPGKIASASTRASVEARIAAAPIGRYKAAALNGSSINAWLADLVRPVEHYGCGLRASTANWLRQLLSSAYTAAIKAEWPAPGWFERNPVYNSSPAPDDLTDEAATLEDYPVLAADEIAPVLMALPPEHRSMYATAIYTGLRQGELFALRITDIDWERRKILVRRSHRLHTTKTRTTRAVPINSDLEAWLRAAVAGREAQGDMLVFPHPGTSAMRQAGSTWCVLLRRALYESGVADPNTSEGVRKLGITFHRLRHTTASLLIEAGATLS